MAKSAEAYTVRGMKPAPVTPQVGKNVYIAPTSHVSGDVVLGDDCTIMHFVMIRGDVSAIRIGARGNIQDHTTIHTKTGIPLDIADDVAIGHRAVVHCRRVGSYTLIGIGAVVLDDCEIGATCVIAAGAVLAPGTIVPGGKVVMGVPGRVVRDTTPRDLEYTRFVLENYRKLAAEHAAGRYPPATGTR